MVAIHTGMGAPGLDKAAMMEQPPRNQLREARMDWNEIISYVDRALNTVLFSISGRGVTLVSLLVFVLIIAITFWISRVLERGVERAFALRGVTDPGLIGNVNRLLHYTALAIGFALALQNIGFDLGALFAAGAIFAVALGFAMQGLVQNFVSGVILLAERTIKNGDVLEVEDEVVRVTRMGLRVTVARTRDEEDLIIPNTTLSQNTIKNYTLRDPEYRLKTSVGVIYGSDMRTVVRVLKEAAESMEFRIQDRSPQILMTGFGDNSVNFEVQVWTRDPWAARAHNSQLNDAIWWHLKDAGITIAFPQLDVHLDAPVVESLQRLQRAG
jgi:small-conductance mechanosensitive channel